MLEFIGVNLPRWLDDKLSVSAVAPPCRNRRQSFILLLKNELEPCKTTTTILVSLFIWRDERRRTRMNIFIIFYPMSCCIVSRIKMNGEWLLHNNPQDTSTLASSQNELLFMTSDKRKQCEARMKTHLKTPTARH